MKSRKTYQEMKELQHQIKNKKRWDIYAKKEVVKLHRNSTIDRNVGFTLKRILSFPKFVMYLLTYPLLAIATVPLLLILVLVVMFMSIKDLFIRRDY